jgi:hypothetical protein
MIVLLRLLLCALAGAVTLRAQTAPAITTHPVTQSVAPGGNVTFLADGTGRAAQFKLPPGITADTAGNPHAAGGGDHVIRKVTLAGVVTTFADPAGAFRDRSGNSSRPLRLTRSFSTQRVRFHLQNPA